MPAGDSVLGYDLEHANLADPDLDKWVARGGSPPEVILVRDSSHLPVWNVSVNSVRVCHWTCVLSQPTQVHIQFDRTFRARAFMAAMCR
jgi:hypothetical protein